MDWIVKKVGNVDAERQHLNKILAEIKAAIGTSGGTTTTNVIERTNTRYAVGRFTLSLDGDVSGSALIDGLSDVALTVTIGDLPYVEEAPLDAQAYWRSGGEWEAVSDAIIDLESIEGNGFTVIYEGPDHERRWVTREIEGTANNIVVTDGTGVDGNPVIDLAAVADSNTGTLQGITVDGFGRVTGTTDGTITGTLNRISVANGTAAAGPPTIDIAATYVGQASITTLGTIGTGAWQGTIIGLPYGGTGADYSSVTQNWVFASPNGSAGAPVFRALVAADIPSLSGIYQPLDSDLTAISALTPSNDDFMQYKAGAWTNRTVAQVKTDLSLSGTNTGDQTSIVGITGTLAQFNTAITDADILSTAAAAAAYQPLDTQLTDLAALAYAGHAGEFVKVKATEDGWELAAGGGGAYTDEEAQDAVGAMIDTTLEYVDATPLLRRAALTGDVTAAAGSNATTLATAQPAVHTWALAQTFTVAPVFTDQAGTRAALGFDAAARAAVVIDSIADSDTDHAPSRNAVFDALALKQPLSTALTDLVTISSFAFNIPIADGFGGYDSFSLNADEFYAFRSGDLTAGVHSIHEVGFNLLAQATPASQSYIRVNTDGTISQRTFSQVLTDLGATDTGTAFFTVPDGAAIGFIRINADNTVTKLTASGFRGALGLGTAATQDTGTSGATIPFLNGTNTWANTQTFTVAPVFTDASGTRTALGFDEAAQDAVAAAFAAGTHTGITVTYTDGSNKFDLAVTGGSGDAVSFAVTQAAHGFSVGHIIQLTGSSWALADRDAGTTVADAIVSAVADANNFTVVLIGKVTLTTGQWDSRTGDAGGLTAGDYYWLSSTAGGLTKTQPTSGVAQCLGVALSTTVMLVNIGEAVEVATLAATSGGTGQSSYAVGDLLYADTTTSLGKRAAVATGNVLKSAGVNTAPVWGLDASGVASNTAASGNINTTETNVISYTVPAGQFVAGQTYRVTVSGICTSTAANASNFRVRVGTANTNADAIAAVVTPTAAASGTNIPFSATFVVTLRVAGASGTMVGSGVLTNNGVTGVSNAAVIVGQVSTSITVDTTVQNFIHLMYVSAAATTTCNFIQGTIELVKA